jgi:hypothetical protein
MKTSSAICFSSQNQCSALVMLIIAGNAAIVTRQMKKKVMERLMNFGDRMGVWERLAS